jgi:iron complex outermembrane receptor protein
MLATSLYAQEPETIGSSPAEPLGAASPAPAPAQDAGQTAQAERVIVTGSNIPTAEEVGPNPVLNINRDLINKRGERSAEELIRALPVANANGVPVSNNATGFTPGASSISLRGFDASATLTLVDGKRVAPYPIGQGATTSFVDLNSIPRAAIDTIEILKDGASSTYGADAVAGVVNIKLRHNYRGAEATVSYGNTLDKDSSLYTADLLFGIGDENTQVSGVINFYHRNSIFNRDRGGLSSKPPFLSTNSSPQNLQLDRDVVIAAILADATATPGEQAAAIAGLPVDGDGVPLQTFFAHAPFFTDGFTGAADYVYSTGRTSLFNFNAFSSSFPESERWGGYVNMEHKICGDQLVLYADMLYQNVKTHNELAPSASGNFQTAGNITIAIPPNTPFPLGPDGEPISPPGTPTSAATGVPAGAFNPFNPFQQIISGGSRLRTAEFGNRIFDDETDAILFTTGLKGDKLFDGNWGYDTSFRYSQIKAVASGQLVSSSRYNRVLNQADPIFGPGGVLDGAAAYNPFGDFRVDIPSNAAVVDFATVRPNDVRYSKLAVLDATLYTTELFKLPAGGVGFAAGGQFRRENIEQIPDQLNLDGDIIGSSPTAITKGGRKTFAFFAETAIPIFSPENAIPIFHSLEFTAAGRYEEFRNNDTNVLVPKLGMRWQPIDDSLTIRATWGKGFREPSLFELFSSPSAALTPTTDPLPTDQGGPPTPVGDPTRFESETPILFSSNPNLQPEDSHAFSAGIVYTPKFVPGLTLAVDVWSIERTGIVGTPDANQVLSREAAGELLPGEFVERDFAGNISRIGFQFQNFGQARARGIDMGIQYQYQSPFGTFTSLTQATYLDSFRLQLTSGDPTLEVSGTPVGQVSGLGTGFSPSTADDGYLKWKGRSSLDWKWNNFDIFASVNYLSGFHETLFTAGFLPDKKKEHWIKHTWTFDIQGTYDFAFAPPVESQPVAGYSKDAKEVVRGKDGKAVETTQTAEYSMPCWKNLVNNTSITVGCNNVFGQDNPTAFGGFGNSTGYPGFIYDAVGRFVYVSLTKKF